MATLQQFMDQTGNEISKDQKWYFDFDAVIPSPKDSRPELMKLFAIYDATYDGKKFLLESRRKNSGVMSWIRPSLAKIIVEKYGKKDKNFINVFGNDTRNTEPVKVTLPDGKKDDIIHITGRVDAGEFFSKTPHIFEEFGNNPDGYVSARKLRVFFKFKTTDKNAIKAKLDDNIDTSKIYLEDLGTSHEKDKDKTQNQGNNGNGTEELKVAEDYVNECKDFKESPFLHNRIIFGAPGTGKSYQANLDANELLLRKHKQEKDLDDNDKTIKATLMERVTFHPEYSYYDFVGSYKPVMRDVPVTYVKKGKLENVQDKQGKHATERKIAYEFVPGPFTRILVEALKKKEQPHLLLIEEINRARVAAVFGDIFQLLDRDGKGESEYRICLSEDLHEHLKKQLTKKEFQLVSKGLYLPENLYIWATMNSADQGVYPLDTAFKRRWSMEYLDINAGAMEDNIGWNTIRRGINELLKPHVNEDKLMGYYFLKEEERSDARLEDSLKSKVLMYLFDDAAKPCKKQIFKQNIHTYSELRNSFSLDEADMGVFEKATSWPGESNSKWKAIRSGINSKLRKCGMPENKMLDFFFLKKEEKENENQLKTALCGKVLNHLCKNVDEKHKSILFQLGNNAEINFDNLKSAMENAMQGEINPNSNLGVFSEALHQPDAGQ